MEPKLGQIKDIDQARIVAKAGKPLIDIAREGWVSDNEKVTLDALDRNILQ